MRIKHLLIVAGASIITNYAVFAQETPTAENTDTPTQELETKLDSELTSPTEISEDGPLIDQYRLIREKNFKAVEFELAKELALKKHSNQMATQEESLYVAALQNLTNAIGAVSEPQKEETYFEYQENPDTGEFVVVLIKDSYVKAERGDLCQVGTQVHLRTSVQEMFTEKLNSTETTEASETANITQIECFNSQRPSYSQRLVN